jgi:AcrR family transcriptional regulator
LPAAKPRQAPVRTPKQGRSKATVAAIMEAGARILAEQGWAGFNTNAVAARAGVSIGSLYEYFPDKQALADDIANAHIAQGEALLAAAAGEAAMTGSAGAIVDALVQGLVDLHKDDPRLHRVLSSEVPLSASVRARVEALRRGAIIFWKTRWHRTCPIRAWRPSFWRTPPTPSFTAGSSKMTERWPRPND